MRTPLFILTIILLASTPAAACFFDNGSVEQAFGLKDVDGDGQLSLQEYYKTVPPKMLSQENREKHFGESDKDKNGSMSFEEFKAEQSTRKCGR